MIITICASIKFFEETQKIEKQLIEMGHKVYMPIKVQGVNYWAKDGKDRVEAKRNMNLIDKHIEKIKKSDAILVANYDKHKIKNYIGANTFVEMIFASYFKKKIFVLNPLPDQGYIIDELLSIDLEIIDGDLTKIK